MSKKTPITASQKISEQHLLPSKLKSGENYLFEARKDENSVIHLIQLFYDHILNKKKIIAMSQELNHVQLRLPILFIASNCPGVFLLNPKKFSSSLPYK